MVVTRGTDSRREGRASPEQLRYARVLDFCMKVALALLVAGFAAYIGEFASPQAPFEELPRLWALRLPDYLREAGMAGGWSWLALPGKGEALALAGIALLAGASIPCLLVLVPLYAGRRDWAYLAITVLLIGVLVIAASGVPAMAF